MYALALVRYRVPLEGILPVLDAHRSYLQDLKAKGLLIASGPLDPRHGGALLLRVPDLESLDVVREGDPYIQAKVAQYELLPWQPNIGLEDLDRL